jgi:hypothetical protein
MNMTFLTSHNGCCKQRSQVASTTCLVQTTRSDAAYLQSDIVKVDRVPAVLETLNMLVLPAPAGKKPSTAKSVPLMLWKSAGNVYIGAGKCQFKFKITSNANLLRQ